MTLADKVVVLNQGRIEQVGSPLALYEKPANTFVAGFLGMPKMSFLEATVLDSNQEGILLDLKSGKKLALPVSEQSTSLSTKATLGVRPEHVILCRPGEGIMDVKVDVAEHLGSDTYCYAQTTQGEKLTIRVDSQQSVTAGQTVGVSFNLKCCHLFNEQGLRV